MESLSNPMRSGFVAALVVILVAAGVAYRNTRHLLEQRQWVAHTHDVRAQLAGLLAQIQDAETSQRGFLLTGEKGFLDRFERADGSMPGRIRGLDTLLSDNPEQARALADLQPHIDARLKRLETGVAVRQRDGIEAARRYVLQGTGARQMDTIRKGIGAMEAVEERLLGQRSHAADVAARTAAATFTTAALLAIVFIGLLYLQLRRFVGTQRRIERDREALLAREQAAREFQQAVMTHMSEGLYTVDAAGLVTFVNEEAERLLGWRADELHGRKMHDLTHYRRPDGSPFPAEECPGLAVLKTGAVLNDHEDSFIRKDGAFFPVVFSATRIVAAGEVQGIVVVFRDVSDQKAAEAEREDLLHRTEQARASAERAAEAEREAREAAESASRTKDAFLATVSHELRTPLSPILTWARMLRQTKIGADRSAHGLEVIERCARAQAQLVEDLLDVSRIVSGKMRMEVRPISLVGVVERAVDVIRSAADAKGVRLRAVLDGEVGPILGDAERLQQVLWNLLSNAVKFTPRGGRVQVVLERADSHAEVSVSDTGQGISASFRPYVFDRFQQADRGPSRAHGGLGLGLAIVRHIVEAHGGSVDVSSDGLGKGAAFSVRLPLMVARTDGLDRRHPTVQHAEASDLQRLDGLRVLVVDDEPDASDAVAELLAACGAETRAASSAEEARSILAGWSPDVLLSDVGMPEEDGYAFIASLRAVATERRQIPAVALTAYASRDDKVRLLSAGFQAHVPKPVDTAELVAVVASIARSAGKLG